MIITVFCSEKGKLTWVELGPVSTLTPHACSWQLWSALEGFLQLRGISGKNKLTVVVWGAAWTNVFFRDRLWLTLQICLTIFYSKCSCCLSSEQEELVWLLSFKWWILSHGKKKEEKKGKPPGNSHRYSLKRGTTNWIYLRYFWFFPLCHNPMQDIWEKRLCSEEQQLTVFFLYLTVHYVVFLQEIFFNALQIGLCNPPVTRGLESQWDNLFYSLFLHCLFYCLLSPCCLLHFSFRYP